MIQDLERHLRERWQLLETAKPPPRRFHFLKLDSEEYPDPRVPFVLFAFAPGARAPLAVAKVARAPEGDAAVEAEAAFLAALNQRLVGALAKPVPCLLQQGHTEGRAFFLMSAMPGEVELHNTWGASRARHSAGRIGAALDWAWNLTQAAPAAPLALRAWIGEEAAMAFLADAERLGWKKEQRATLEQRLQAAWETLWPAGVAHGDFFPGNILFQGNRLSGVVDWSTGEERVPVFLDTLVYETSFAVQAARQGNGPDSGTLRDVHDLAPFVAARQRFSAVGIDAGLPSPARLATLLAMHRTARSNGREPMRLAMVRILAALLDA